jgi:hypothetical protein
MTNEQEHKTDQDKKGETQETTERRRIITIGLENMEDVDKAVREAVSRSLDAASTVGGTIKDTILKVKTARDSVVMVRVNKESLDKLDELVDSGINSSRSEAAAFMIAEGIKSKATLFSKISEKTEMIRKTREDLRKLLDEDDVPSETKTEED